MLPAALLATGAASIFSNGLSALGQSFVNRTDKDKSGGVSLEEFSSFLQAGQKVPTAGAGPATSTPSPDAAKARFDKIDTNADGTLSAGEVNTYNQQLVSQIQAALVQLQQVYGAGAGQSGVADKSSQIFAKMDANGDGAISKDEFSAFQSTRKKKHGQQQGGLAALMQALDQVSESTKQGSAETGKVSSIATQLAATAAYKKAA